MFVHGNNLEQKENHQTKYRDAESRRYLVEIRARYNQWKAANEALVGPVSVAGANDAAIIARRVELLNDYKSFQRTRKKARAAELKRYRGQS